MLNSGMNLESLGKFKDKFSKFGDTLPVDWQRDIKDLLRDINQLEANFNQYAGELNKTRKDKARLEEHIKSLEADKLFGQVELRKLHIQQDGLKDIDQIEEKLNQCTNELNKTRRDNLRIEGYIKTLEADKLLGQIELRKLYLKQKEGES